MPVTFNNFRDVLLYPGPGPGDPEKYAAVQLAGQELAKAILLHTPVCGDQQAALRHLREAVMTANAAIALKGAV
jgi:hypothetical protein